MCRVLSSEDVLSTDEGSSSDDDDDEFDQLEKNLESLISSKKTATQVSKIMLQMYNAVGMAQVVVHVPYLPKDCNVFTVSLQ